MFVATQASGDGVAIGVAVISGIALNLQFLVKWRQDAMRSRVLAREEVEKRRLAADAAERQKRSADEQRRISAIVEIELTKDHGRSIKDVSTRTAAKVEKLERDFRRFVLHVTANDLHKSQLREQLAKEEAEEAMKNPNAPGGNP